MNDRPGEPTLSDILKHEALQESVSAWVAGGREAGRAKARELGERLESIASEVASAVLKSERRPLST